MRIELVHVRGRHADVECRLGLRSGAREKKSRRGGEKISCHVNHPDTRLPKAATRECGPAYHNPSRIVAKQLLIAQCSTPPATSPGDPAPPAKRLIAKGSSGDADLPSWINSAK